MHQKPFSGRVFPDPPRKFTALPRLTASHWLDFLGGIVAPKDWKGNRKWEGEGGKEKGEEGRERHDSPGFIVLDYSPLLEIINRTEQPGFQSSFLPPIN